MSVITSSGGIGFGTRSKAVILGGGKSTGDALQSPGKYANPRPGVYENLGNVAMWGANNNLPFEMMQDIEATGVLMAGIDAKARIAIGKGPTPAKVVGFDNNGYETLEFVVHPETSLFLETHRAFETSYAISKDLFGYGNAFIQILLSRDRKQIVGFKREDTTKCRFSKVDDKTGRSEFVYVSADWQQWYSEPDKLTPEAAQHITKVPLLDKDYPLYDLQSRTNGYTFMIAIQYPLTGRNYYAPSPWYSARKWVKIAQSIPEMKAAMFANQMNIKYLVEIHPQMWELYDPTYKAADDAKKLAIQKKFYDDIDKHLVGEENSYKSIFSTTVIDRFSNQPVPGLKITEIDDKMKDGKLLPDGASAEKEIMFALMMNPALVGIDIPGGGAIQTAGSGSNIREAYLVQVMLGEVERRMNSTIYNIARAYNGWPADIVIRYPNQILTTLNTGANTQSTA